MVSYLKTCQFIVMVFETPSYKEELMSFPNCIAHLHFIKKVGWGKQDTGHVLVSQLTGDELMAIPVGKVSTSCLLCGPEGNFRTKSKVQNDFSKARFQLTLDTPDEPVLVPIYKAGLSALTKLQKAITETSYKTKTIMHLFVSRRRYLKKG